MFDSNRNQKILITGASGTVGNELVKQLLSSTMPHSKSSNLAIRAGVRSKKGVDKLSNYSGLETVEFDYNKHDTVASSFKDVTRLFLLTIPNPRLKDSFSNVIKLAKDSGVSYIVKLSVQETIDPEPKTMLGRLHKHEEKIIEESGIPHTFLCPTGFMQNFVTFYGYTIKMQNAFYNLAGDGKAGFIDVRDIASVATKILLSEGPSLRQYENQSFNLTGPEALSFGQIADIISNVVGRKISYINITETESRENMEKLGMERWLVDAIIEINGIIKAGKASEITPVVENITGRKPYTFEQFVKDNIALFN
jgi:uncharacterized protein YbjT (DUF2867 family)